MKFTLFLDTCAARNTNILLTQYTEKSETNIPKPSINQNPLIRLIPKMNSISATMNPVRLLSQIADQDFLKPSLLACLSEVVFLNSSLILSNIRILASIAIPIDSINPATEARVKTIPSVLTIDNTNITYINSDIDARTPETLYMDIKNTKIRTKPVTQAISNFSSELDPSFESIDCSEVRYIGAGTTHVLISVANCFADSGV